MSLPRSLQLAVGLLLIAQCGFFAGCNSGSTSDFRTYDQLLTKEQSRSDSADAEDQPSVTANQAAGHSPSAEDAHGSIAPEQLPQSFIPDSVAQPAPEPELTSSGDTYPDIPASAWAPLNVVNGSSASDVLQVAARSTGSLPPASAAEAVATATVVKPTSPLTRGIELLIASREFREEGPQQALRVSYDDLDLLKILNMEPVPADAARHFPPWLADLNGKPVRIRGFMYPTFESSGIESFVLARDNQICCFGRDPKVYDLIQVSMKSGTSTDYIPNRPFDVVGTFRIDMLADGGKPLGLYWLDDARVLAR
ncbi:MAG: hypothetical protein B7Z55_06775 [Planctomycetales bacterium 12-60-4]|nr:MAG: hypothetical protein B7Z55_06775 [Planctomycetales bacterium 12-60-4]